MKCKSARKKLAGAKSILEYRCACAMPARSFGLYLLGNVDDSSIVVIFVCVFCKSVCVRKVVWRLFMLGSLFNII